MDREVALKAESAKVLPVQMVLEVALTVVGGKAAAGVEVVAMVAEAVASA